MVINESLARRLWPGQDAIGQRFTFLPLSGDVRVVGVVSDGKYGGLREFGRSALYLPWEQNRFLGFSSGAVIVRTDRNTRSLVPLIQQEIRSFDSELSIVVATLGDRIAELAMPQRLGTTLLGWFSTLALALAVVGGYGAVAYVVTQRTREIGIRMALGAPSSAVVRLVLANSMLAVGVGLAVGLVGAYALTRFTAPFLFGIAPRDPWTLAAVTAGVFVATLLATAPPARRAAHLDPMDVLRAE